MEYPQSCGKDKSNPNSQWPSNTWERITYLERVITTALGLITPYNCTHLIIHVQKTSIGTWRYASRDKMNRKNNSCTKNYLNPICKWDFPKYNADSEVQNQIFRSTVPIPKYNVSFPNVLIFLRSTLPIGVIEDFARDTPSVVWASWPGVVTPSLAQALPGRDLA